MSVVGKLEVDTVGAATRERLLDAAAELFYERGVHVGVDAVCRTSTSPTPAVAVTAADTSESSAAGCDSRSRSVDREAPSGIAPPIIAATDVVNKAAGQTVRQVIDQDRRRGVIE